MKLIRLYTILVCLCLASTVLADTPITLLPFECDTPGETYYFMGDLEWAGATGDWGILMSAPNVRLNINGFEYTFGTAGVANKNAIEFAWDIDGVEIYDGTITHAPPDPSAALDRTNAIELNHNAYTTIRNVDIYITGRVSLSEHYNGIHGILINGQTQHHNRVVSCLIENAVTGFWDREDRQACAISTNYTDTDPAVVDYAVDYTLKVDSCEIYYCNIGIMCGEINGGGGDGTVGVYHIEYNRFIGRIRNNGPWVGYRFGNAFAVDMRHVENIRARGNYFNRDVSQPTLYFGGQAYFFNAVGTVAATDTNIFIGDTIISSGWTDGDNGIGHPSGVKIRGNVGPTIFEDCIFEAYANTDPNDSTHSRRAQNVELGHSYEPSSTIPYLEFKNCSFKSLNYGLGGADSLFNMFFRYAPGGQGNIIFTENCRFESDGMIFTYGDVVTSSQVEADSIFSYNDTFVLGPDHNGWSIFGNYYNSVKNSENYIINPTYQNGAVWDFDYGTSNTQYLTEQIICSVLVVDALGNPVAGATVTGDNNFGNTVISGTTDANGIVFDTISTNFISRADPDTTNAQYNPFDLTVSYSGDMDNNPSVQFDVTNRTVTMTLSSTALLTLTPGTPTLVCNTSTTDNDLLEAGRRNANFNEDGSVLYLVPKREEVDGNANRGWYYSTDDMATFNFVDGATSWSGVAGRGIDEHSGTDYAGGLHFASIYSTNLYYRFIAPPGDDVGDLGTTRTLWTGSSLFRPGLIAVADNDVWVFQRDGNSSNGIVYQHSTDQFATVDASGTVVDFDATDGSQYRMFGSGMVDPSSNPVLTVMFDGDQGDDSNDGYHVFGWNGSSWGPYFNGSSFAFELSNAYLYRMWTDAIIGDTVHIIVAADGVLYHAYGTPSGLITSSTAPTQIWNSGDVTIDNMQPTCGVRNGILYLMYNDGGDATGDFVMRWFRSDLGWSDTVTVSDPSHQPSWGSIPPVCNSTGDYIPVFYLDILNDAIYSVKVDISASGGSTPPNNVTSISQALVQQDYSGETDEIEITTNMGTSTADTVVFIWSTSSQPTDPTSGTNRTAFAFSASSQDQRSINVDGTETYTLYLTVWTKSIADGYSSAMNDSETYNQLPDPTRIGIGFRN